MPYAKKKQLFRHLKNLQAEVIIVDIGAGTSYHALNFFLMADALSDQDFCSVEAVLAVAGQIDETSCGVAKTALRTFHPTLILNRLSGRAHVNVATLKKILKEYIGGDLTLLGEIPDDPAMERAVRGYRPIVDGEPAALAAIADTLLTRIASPAS